MNTTAAELGFDLSDYSLYPDPINACYVFLIEPMTENTKINTDELSACLLKHLRIANPEFGLALDIGRFNAPMAYWLQPQTAILYRDLEVMKGASANQVKPVRIIINEKQRKFFFALRG